MYPVFARCFAADYTVVSMAGGIKPLASNKRRIYSLLFTKEAIHD